MIPYNPKDWYWIVAADESKAWSSSSGAYVPDYPKDAVTRIDSEQSLSDVLRPHGLTLPAPTQEDYGAAIQVCVDVAAKKRDYADGATLAGYYASTIPRYADDAKAFIAWRDQVWIYAYTELAKVQGGQRQQPSIEELIAELPLINW